VQPYAIAMKDGSPFGLAGLWENWMDSATGHWVRTFAIITVPSNDLVGQIHDRMPAILPSESYERWLGPDPDPHDLLISFPSEPMSCGKLRTILRDPVAKEHFLTEEGEIDSAMLRVASPEKTGTDQRTGGPPYYPLRVRNQIRLY
jgi:putative SOS response-associated peptidase YedK